MGKYSVQGSAGHVIDNTYVPALVGTPSIFIAPSALAASSGEIWLAVSCPDKQYGGCVVLGSVDGSTYKEIGRIVGQSSQGVLLSSLPAHAAGDDNTSILSVRQSLYIKPLESVTQAALDASYSLCFVGGEALAYKTASLTGATGGRLEFSLSGLRRGLYGTPSPLAPSGSDFVLINKSIFKYRFNQELVGKTVYFKLRAFNSVGQGYQDIADLTAYSFVVSSSGGVKATLADLASVSGGGGSASLSFSANNAVVGVTPTLVGSVSLPAGSYSAPAADVGCGDPSKAATLEIRNQSGTVLATIGGSAGGVQWRTASTGFTLSTKTNIDFILYSNATDSVAFVRGVSF